jgi:hypothetical protein
MGKTATKRSDPVTWLGLGVWPVAGPVEGRGVVSDGPPSGLGTMPANMQLGIHVEKKEISLQGRRCVTSLHACMASSCSDQDQVRLFMPCSSGNTHTRIGFESNTRKEKKRKEQNKGKAGRGIK